MQSLFDSVFADDTDLREEVQARNVAGRMPVAAATGVSTESIDRLMTEVAPGGARGHAEPIAEAIVLLDGRPSLLVQNGTYQEPSTLTWRERLAPARSRIEHAIQSVGRIEIANHPFLPYAGTGWLIAENLVCTNRHVAEVFALREGDRFTFAVSPDGGPYRVRIDFKEEFNVLGSAEIGIGEIVHIHAPAGEDFAFLKVKPDGLTLPPPLILDDLGADAPFIGVIGYPARDPRNDPDIMMRLFGDIYDVKRFAPGTVMQDDGGPIFLHNCTTLGGNSGSAVISLETGRVVGLHFAGRFRVANHAVKSGVLKETMTQLGIQVPIAPPPIQPVIPEADDTIDTPRDVPGYDPGFLGPDAGVPLPGFGSLGDRVLRVAGDDPELRYTHFSIVMHRTRKLAIVAACNVDGRELRRVPRGGGWILDARIGPDQQHGNDLYRNNFLDRGHIVRRLSPVWGDIETARKANEDTFHYTNAFPQHQDLNQNFWLGLEDFILDTADAADTKISILTGPVFDAGDPKHRGVQIPRQFWKIVAFRGQADGALRASAYLLGQEHLIRDMPEEVPFGAFKTYQVSVDLIARLTSLDFGPLADADVLAGFETVGLRELNRYTEVIL